MVFMMEPGTYPDPCETSSRLKALIKVGYGCNEHCTFCHTLDVRHLDGESAEVTAKIDRAARLGHTMVVLSGGEPTIRPELLTWASHISALGLDLGLVTNGRMLAYPDLVERLVERRLKYAYVSLHGGSARVHNALVRADGWDETMRALTNLSGRGLDLTINCVVTRQNLGALREVVDATARFTDAKLKFSMVQPKGGGEKLFDQLTPRVADVAAAVADAIGHAGSREVRHDGIPLCLLPGLEDRYDDLRTHRFATMVEIGEPDIFPVDDAAKIQPTPCAGCALRGPCPGLFRGYHEAFGDGELRPIAGARANSFNYVFERVDAWPGQCPIRRDGTTPWDRGRHLFVKNGERLARFRAETRDFADVELVEIKARGQVYVDRSTKPAPDDFAADLAPLDRSPICDPCPEKPRCTGLWEPAFEDRFTRDDERVREILRELRGDVLDVGCGDLRYDDLLARPEIRYTGVDPRAVRRAWGRYLDAVPDEDFDAILILRAWNHLPEIPPLRLRPGGTLLVVDNVPFGLARTKAQAARAESSPATQEHARNDDAGAAAARITGFTLVERRDVAPGTSNQWLLRYTRPPDG
jgi:MoaA/NifB/PqqE/SkfB family radical SAM enzyme